MAVGHARKIKNNKNTFLLNSKVPKDNRGVNHMRHRFEIGVFSRPKYGRAQLIETSLGSQAGGGQIGLLTGH